MVITSHFTLDHNCKTCYKSVLLMLRCGCQKTNSLVPLVKSSQEKLVKFCDFLSWVAKDRINFFVDLKKIRNFRKYLISLKFYDFFLFFKFSFFRKLKPHGRQLFRSFFGWQFVKPRFTCFKYIFFINSEYENLGYLWLLVVGFNF